MYREKSEFLLYRFLTPPGGTQVTWRLLGGTQFTWRLPGGTQVTLKLPGSTKVTWRLPGGTEVTRMYNVVEITVITLSIGTDGP